MRCYERVGLDDMDFQKILIYTIFAYLFRAKLVDSAQKELVNKADIIFRLSFRLF